MCRICNEICKISIKYAEYDNKYAEYVYCNMQNMNIPIFICRICNKYAKYTIHYVEYEIKYVKQYAEYAKKICKAICNMQNSDKSRFCIFVIRMHSPLC